MENLKKQIFRDQHNQAVQLTNKDQEDAPSSKEVGSNLDTRGEETTINNVKPMVLRVELVVDDIIL